MRAVVLTEFGPADVLVSQEVERPEPGAGEVRVRVGATAVLSTRDVATRSGRHPFSKLISPPHVLGGEFAGVVDGFGPGTGGAPAIGTRVAASSVIVCGECEACSRGRDEACGDFEMIGIHRAGSYGEFALVPTENLYPIPDDLPFDEAAVIAATGPVARAQLEAAGVGTGSWVAVPGAGGALGSLVVALARDRGANVIALERPGVGERELTELLGVAAVIATDGDGLADRIRAATDGHGLDAVVDNLAIPALFSACVASLAPLGKVVISGAIGGAPLEFEPVPLYIKCQSILGVRTGNRVQVAAFWDDVADGFRFPRELINRFALEEAAAAHATLEAHERVGHFVLTTDLEGSQV